MVIGDGPAKAGSAEAGALRLTLRSSSSVQVLLALSMGAGLAWLVAREIDLGRIQSLLRSIAPLYVVLAVLAFTVDFLARAVRFWVMLCFATGRALPLRPTIAPFIASFGVSDILPFRAGDAFRVYWFHTRIAVPVGTIVGAMIIERLLDLVSILIIGAVAVACNGSALQADLVGTGQVALAAIVGAGAVVLLKPQVLADRLERLLHTWRFAPVLSFVKLARSIADAISAIGSVRRILCLVLASVGLWIVEFVVFLCAWLGLGGALQDWLKPGLAFAFATLGTLIPALPGHFGSFEYFGVNAFMMTGVDATAASAVIFSAHLVLWAPTALFAVGWLSLSHWRRRHVSAIGSAQ